MTYQVRMMQTLGEVGRKLVPEIKKAARQALREIAENPFLGKPLKDELSGYHSYRFLRWRIVYKIEVEEKVVTVVEALIAENQCLVDAEPGNFAAA